MVRADDGKVWIILRGSRAQDLVITLAFAHLAAEGPIDERGVA
jgi:hypothetical protein